MLLSVQCWVDITTIIANIVTILGIGSLIGIGVSIVKNRFNEKTVTVQLKSTGSSTPHNSPSLNHRISISLDLFNSTDKTFFITGIIFNLNKSEFYLSSENSKYPNDKIVRNICIESHGAKTITGWIETPSNFKIPDTVKIKIKSTVKDLEYTCAIQI